MIFRDREQAGQLLAHALDHYRGNKDLLVLGLPRGGVPVAREVAQHLNAPLDVLIVRKLGVPWQPELALGAVATGGVVVFNDSVLSHVSVSDRDLRLIAEREWRELKRREGVYRGLVPEPQVAGKTVILVDDGIATGSTMRAGVKALRSQGPARIVVAVPVAPSSTVRSLLAEADEVVCLQTPEDFGAVGSWYRNFSQLTDQEVRALLGPAHRAS